MGDQILGLPEKMFFGKTLKIVKSAKKLLGIHRSRFPKIQNRREFFFDFRPKSGGSGFRTKEFWAQEKLEGPFSSTFVLLRITIT